MSSDVYAVVLIDVAVILVAAWLGGEVFRRLRQPPVIGEVVVGILLGPTLLGDVSTTVFPLDARPLWKVLATIGVVVFMFVVGLEVDRSQLRTQARASGAVSVGGMVVPFVLGVLLALGLRSSYGGGDAAFVLFIGVAMSITAFPVLVRILVDRRIAAQPLGVLVIGAAAVDDLVAWLLLAGVASLAAAESGVGVAVSAALLVAFAVVMFVAVRPLLARFGGLEPTPAAVTLVLAGLFASAYATSAIGVHEIFGAFLLGLVFPRGRLERALRPRLEVVGLVFLPVFFVATGFSVDLSGLGGAGAVQFLAIVLVAFGGKLGGAFVGARSPRGRDARVPRHRRAHEHTGAGRADRAGGRPRDRRDRQRALFAARAHGGGDYGRHWAAARPAASGPDAGRRRAVVTIPAAGRRRSVDGSLRWSTMKRTTQLGDGTVR